jgi:hypothetical protein
MRTIKLTAGAYRTHVYLKRLEMKDQKKKRIFLIVITVFWVLFFLIPLLLVINPTIRFNNQKIRLFAGQRMEKQREGFFRPPTYYYAQVRRNYTIKTEYGEIYLKRNADMLVRGNTIEDMGGRKDFEKGLVSHNLVVEGIEIPQDASIGFNADQRIARLLDTNNPSDITISGLRLEGVDMRLNYADDAGTMDIIMDFRIELITLNDGTEIRFVGSPFPFRTLHMYNKTTNYWRIVERQGRISVTFYGETEPVRYKSITFRPHWGEFIEGELFEE